MAKDSVVKNNSPTTFVEVANSSQPKKWLPWGVVACVGLALFLFSSHEMQKRQASVARTALVVADLQSSVQGYGNEAIQVARGNPAAVENMRNWRSKITVLSSLLERGGYVSANDSAPVIALQGPMSQSLTEMKKGVSELDNQVKNLEESVAQLRESSQAEAKLEESLTEINAAWQSIDRVSSLRDGQVGSIISSARSVLTRPEMKTMRVIFSPIPGAEALQNSWSQQFVQTANQLRELSRVIDSTSVPVIARNQVKSLSESVIKLAQSSSVLAQTQQTRLNAQVLQAPIQSSLIQAQKPLNEMGTDILEMQNISSIYTYLWWVGIGFLLSGFVGLVKSAASLGKDHWAVSQESKENNQIVSEIEKHTRHLRRLINNEGSSAGNSRLEENRNEFSFQFVLMINNLLDNNERMKERAGMIWDAQSIMLNELDGGVNRVLGLNNKLQEKSEKASALAKAIAISLAKLGRSHSFQAGRKMVENTAESERLIQDSAINMDELREKIQNASKLLKKQAESSQVIIMAINVINEIGKRVKVLSTNATIAAASERNGNGKSAALAKEIEKLSQSIQQSTRDADKVVAEMQADTQKTISTVEEGIADLVKIADLNSRASLGLRELGKYAEDLAANTESLIRELEKQAINNERLSNNCDETVALAKEGSDIAGGVSKSNGQIKLLTKDAKQEFDGI